MRRHARSLALTALLVLGACGSGQEAVDPTGPTATASEPRTTPTVQDVMKLGSFAPLEPGTYFIDPDADPITTLRVVYEIPVGGWGQWMGATKGGADHGHLALSITTVTNVVRQACRNHAPADPPVGPSVDDLATALADWLPSG